jgi:hypothetical protein
MPEHGHRGDHLMIALNDQELTNAVVAGDMSQIASHAGDALWLEAGIDHRVMNRGTRPARFLTMQIERCRNYSAWCKSALCANSVA